MKAKRLPNILIKPDHKRLLFRPFKPLRIERILKIIARIMALSESKVKRELNQVIVEFGHRHQKLEKIFLMRFEEVRKYLLTDEPLSEERKLLIGAYFTQEYSLESAALFNPSMIWHPDQSDLPEGSRRFILSLRATGEGHISSITFRTGVIDTNHNIQMEEPTRFVTSPEIHPNPFYEKSLFEQKLIELELLNDFTSRVMAGLEEFFTLHDLQENISYAWRQSRNRDGDHKTTANAILALAESNYEISFSSDDPLCERIIFPSSIAENNGIEDARFVGFCDDDGSIIYYATYTAYDGKTIFPQLIETTNFLEFKVSTLNGPAVHNKGFALFPRKINGSYVMLSRQDNENIYLMFSDRLHFWYDKNIILKPTYPWEFIQIGNCGSPIETEAGWLVISHGVGYMRKYAMSAFLLDLDDPTRVIGRLREPLLSPNENEREGYVPNVVYSCGSQIHERMLIIPYAIADYVSTFAIVDLDELLTELTS